MMMVDPRSEIGGSSDSGSDSGLVVAMVVVVWWWWWSWLRWPRLKARWTVQSSTVHVQVDTTWGQGFDAILD